MGRASTVLMVIACWVFLAPVPPPPPHHSRIARNSAVVWEAASYMRSARTIRRFWKVGIGVQVCNVSMSLPRTCPVIHESVGLARKVSLTRYSYLRPWRSLRTTLSRSPSLPSCRRASGSTFLCNPSCVLPDRRSSGGYLTTEARFLVCGRCRWLGPTDYLNQTQERCRCLT